MNDLLSSSQQSPPTNNIEMTNVGNLEKFFQDTEIIKTELNQLQTLHSQLQSSHDQSKTLHNAKSIKDLRSQMDKDVTLSLKKAKLIKSHLESLDRSNAATLKLPGCGPGSSSDRTRSSVVNSLRKKLQISMNSFSHLRERIATEYRDIIERRYIMVTGEKADESTMDLLIETGESETFMQKAIREQGRGQVMDTVLEIQERHQGVKEIEKNLKELHQVFMDMAVLVESQGEQLDDIESQVGRASSFVRDGAQQLAVARKHQKNTRKWTCCGIILLLIIILIILFTIRPWE